MRKTIELCAILLLVAPFLFVTATAPYIPNRNEVWQLHAAARMAAGLGYTTYWNIPEDLSRIHGDFLIAWPAGYSIITAGLMKLGLRAYAAAKVLKIVLIVAAVLLWRRLGRRFLSGNLTQVLFAVYICAAAVFISYSLTDLFCWASMSILTLSMLAYADDRAVRHLFVAGIVLGAMILMRYHSLFLLPVAVVWSFFVSEKMSVKGRLVRVMVIVSIPLLVYLVIAATNISAEGQLSTITAKVVKPGFQWEWLRDLPGVVLLGGGVFLESLSGQLSDGVLAGLRDLMIAIVGWALFFGMLVIVRRMLAEHSHKRRELAVWLSLASIGLVLFLGFLSISRYGDERWAPITEERYYWILGPLMVLQVLVLIEDLIIARIQPKWTRLGIGAALAAGLLAITGYSINRYERYSSEALLRQNLVSTLKEISAETASNTVVFSDQFVPLLLLNGRFPVYKNADGRLPSRTRFSDWTTLVWVTNDSSFDWRSSKSMRSRSLGTNVYLFWETFSPGTFSEHRLSAETNSPLACRSRFVQLSHEAAVLDALIADAEASRPVLQKRLASPARFGRV